MGDGTGTVIGIVGVTGHTGAYAPARFVRTLVTAGDRLSAHPQWSAHPTR